MKIEIKHEQGLGTIHDDALLIRKAVFIVEQGVNVADELNDQSAEENAIHIVAYANSKLAATARVIIESDNIWHIQRVATLQSLRGYGLGTALLNYIEDLAPSYNIQQLVLGAQIQARGFYELLGFETTGTPFMEAGIEHIHMKKEL
ncbi:acetyltransferase [Leuconostoc litchii]|uniref:GNAT family N-acetyltransferase n=1 Tax=Leuconostoc litchii TaxID=1981069 RepID=A0A6P2CLQ2_9LACO|nr:GNAT family N-acetyltransferase [Leuconostoc litchii]TYC46216.1 GNAT family N-acetyltransferase [Leuconostoc litchii]GMA69919.1 acetyltransferase [Leuconostoc litchii]